ncbi:MAG: hypothetical protein WBX25_34740 [Rhodomicrobium sp.]
MQRLERDPVFIKNSELDLRLINEVKAQIAAEHAEAEQIVLDIPTGNSKITASENSEEEAKAKQPKADQK